MATRIPAKLSEKVADRLDEHASRHERQARKEAKRAEALDKLTSRLSVLDVWTRTGPSGRRPRFTRDEIAAAAVRIADDEGFASLSMRRLAAELDAGTMTLYHYVRTKDELLMLVTDAVLGEVVVDEPLPDDWRGAMTVLAHRTRDALVAHPWILDITDDPAIGPNSVRHFDQSLQAVSSLSVDLTLRLDLVSAVDEYVFGHCLAARNNLGDPAPSLDMVRYVESLLATGDYPQLFELAETLGLDVGWHQIEGHLRDARRFDRNLARLLDGFAAEL